MIMIIFSSNFFYEFWLLILINNEFSCLFLVFLTLKLGEPKTQMYCYASLYLISTNLSLLREQ